MTINNRHYLNDLLDKLNLSVNAFEKEIGAGTGTINKIVSGNTDRDLSIKTIRKIIKKYPDINQVWLQTGKGEMFISDSKDGGNTGLLAQLKNAWDKYIKGIGLEDEATSRANRKLVDEIMQRIDGTKDKIDKAQGK